MNFTVLICKRTGSFGRIIGTGNDMFVNPSIVPQLFAYDATKGSILQFYCDWTNPPGRTQIVEDYDLKQVKLEIL